MPLPSCPRPWPPSATADPWSPGTPRTPAATSAAPAATRGCNEGNGPMRKHAIAVDLGYGDAGKGGIVDWLCTPGSHPAAGGPVHTVVRFNGGAQAAHNVVTPGGRHHTFAQ